MKMLIGLVLAILTVGAAAGDAAAAPQRDAKAERVLARAKAASGGAAWDRLEGAYEEGMHGDMPYRVWLDYRAWGRRVEAQGPGATMVMGYDGKVAWRKAGDVVTRMTDAASLSEARVSAFVSNNAYFQPGRFPAGAKYVRRARDRTGDYDVIEMAPEGARPVRLWFDRRTRLLARIDDFAGTPPVVVHLSDFRRVDGVLIAFGGTITDASGREIDRGAVRSVVHRRVSRSLFEPDGGGD